MKNKLKEDQSEQEQGHILISLFLKLIQIVKGVSGRPYHMYPGYLENELTDFSVKLKNPILQRVEG